MKKTLKILLVIGIVVLLSIISFGGIYVKEDFKYEDKVPDYQLASNLGKTKIATLEVDTSVNEVKYDANGNKVTESTNTSTDENSEENKTNYTTKEEPVNSEEALTAENYKKSKEIVEKRLKSIGLPQYVVRLEENTGNIQIELQDHENAEAGIYYSSFVGKVEIVNNQNNEVVMNNDDISKITVGYDRASTTENSYQVYMNVDLNNQGKEKLQKIMNNQENNKEESTDDEDKTEPGLIFKFEDEEVSTVNISEINTANNLKVNVGSASSTSSTINNNLNQATVVALLTDSGKMPIKYNASTSEKIQTPVEKEQIQYVLYVFAGIFALASLYMIAKYKSKGIYITLSNIGAVAILMLLVRYTNVLISYETVSAFAILELALIAISIKILANIKDAINIEDAKKKIKQAYINCIDIFVVILAIAIVFTFTNWTGIASIGMVMFWGIISILITQFVLARTLLIEDKK